MMELMMINNNKDKEIKLVKEPLMLRKGKMEK